MGASKCLAEPSSLTSGLRAAALEARARMPQLLQLCQLWKRRWGCETLACELLLRMPSLFRNGIVHLGVDIFELCEQPCFRDHGANASCQEKKKKKKKKKKFLCFDTTA